MPEIKCPHCGTTFTVDQTEYSRLLSNVKDDAFHAELEARSNALSEKEEVERRLLAKDYETQTKDLEAKLKEQETKTLMEKKALEEELTRQKAQAKMDTDLALANEKARYAEEFQQAQSQIEALKSQIALKDKDLEAKLKEQESKALMEKKALEDELARQKEQAQKEIELALANEKARYAESFQQANFQIESLKNQIALKDKDAQLQREKDAQEKVNALLSLQNELELQKRERTLAENEIKKGYEDRLRAAQAETDYYKDLKARMSTKMVGETLEQHCLIEFNKIRTTAFPNAYFEKDNDASEGSKGDFIFRETDPDGIEILSIMFEMKNELDETATKHKNEDFFAKLDKDRKTKKCEYAVLVSLLEEDNDFYNAGIADVSFRYEKMYVIRPQCFIPMITLLRNAALKSQDYRRELAQQRTANIDVTKFENKLLDFQEKFGRNYELAKNHFEKAIVEIDNTISHLQKVRDSLTKSSDQLKHANDKAQDLSVKKLTYDNPTMKKAFEDAKENN